ncbi:ninja-family protein 6-like [Cornus florida]|uniref:ninja-family protein 6-like n=1 Tax=Cornus florida TaxID=4283 RepID=UPI00289CC975|nr:ninja-family protein 6-like [Cornus florida]
MAGANQSRVTKILFPLRSNGHQTVSLEKFRPQNLRGTELSESGVDLNLGLSLGGGSGQIHGTQLLIRPALLAQVWYPNVNDEIAGKEERRRMMELHRMRRFEAARRLLEKQMKRKRAPRVRRVHQVEPQAEELPPRPNSPSQLVAWAQQSVARNPALCRALQIIKDDKGQGPGNSAGNTRSQKFQPKEMPKRKPVKPAVAVTTSGPMANGIPSKPAETEHGRPSRKTKRTAPGTIEKKIPSKPAENEHGGPSKRTKWTTSGTMANAIPSKPAATEPGESSKKNKPPCSKGMGHDGVEAIMKQMPGVTTTGDGPNGRTIQGFLYRCAKEKVNIVCNCHAQCHSPAEFVKHAGGSDMVNPMKRINVLPKSF